MHHSGQDEGARNPTPIEERLIQTLIAGHFRGAERLRDQLDGLRVSSIDADGSLRLLPVPGAGLADVKQRIPVEASYLDTDSVRVHLLVHVVDGLLNELEVFREDSGRVLTPPNLVSKMDVIVW